jgi:AbrB family looped-hinge helix DNA binding protein
MSGGEKRTVGERGQVTLPEDLREAFGISSGDEVVVRSEGGRILIEPSVSKADLAEGYRKRADRDRELADETDGVSAEADAGLGDAPDW